MLKYFNFANPTKYKALQKILFILQATATTTVNVEKTSYIAYIYINSFLYSLYMYIASYIASYIAERFYKMFVITTIWSSDMMNSRMLTKLKDFFFFSVKIL